MTAKGANAEGQNVYLCNVVGNLEFVPAEGAAATADYWDVRNSSNPYIHHGVNGNDAVGRQTGGGGQGGANHGDGNSKAFVYGGAGTSYSGGGSGCWYRRGIGGVGAVSGASRDAAYTQVTGSGDLLIIFTSSLKGNGIFSSEGIGATNPNWGSSGFLGCGGSSGGGSINIFCLKNEGNFSFSVKGGSTVHTSSGWQGGARGGNGGAGSYNVSLITFYKYLVRVRKT